MVSVTAGAAVVTVPGYRTARSWAATASGGFRSDLCIGFFDDFDAFAKAGRREATSIVQAARAGAVTLRFPVRWDHVQPEPNVWDWSAYEPLRQQLLANTQIGVLPVLVGCPTWISSGERAEAGDGLSYPSGSAALDAFGEFVVSVLDWFSRDRDCVSAIEVWSAPNDAGGATIADPAAYSRMLSTAALYVDSVNQVGRFKTPVELLSGGLLIDRDGAWMSYLAGFADQLFPYAVGVQLFDTASSNQGSPEAYGAQVAEEIGQRFEQVAKATTTEIWVTATGASSATPWGDDGQAEAMSATATNLASRSRCRAIVAGPLQPKPDMGSSDGARSASPLLTTDWEPTPAMDRFCQLVSP